MRRFVGSVFLVLAAGVLFLSIGDTAIRISGDCSIGVGAEPKAAVVVKLLDRAGKTERPFLNQIFKG